MANYYIAYHRKPISELRSINCHMGSHIVTCHPTQVNAPCLNPSQIGWYLIYLPQRDGRLSWPKQLVTYQDGLPARIQVLTRPGIEWLCWSDETHYRYVMPPIQPEPCWVCQVAETFSLDVREFWLLWVHNAFSVVRIKYSDVFMVNALKNELRKMYM